MHISIKQTPKGNRTHFSSGRKGIAVKMLYNKEIGGFTPLCVRLSLGGVVG